MTPERWRRIESLFHEAADLPADRRASYIEEECRGDAELARNVEVLLAADADPAALLESAADRSALFESVAAPLLERADREPNRPHDPAAPARVGPYRILEEIGRGGMGTVYLAERADGLYERRVALKLVKRGMDTDQILRRFRQERKILARLEHPNIARFYDGGVSEEGRPYLVMEYVEGRPIDAYCDAHRLGIDQRLALFRTACEAVQHAHRHLIVHRDLKPSNILVNAAGHVKLLDFGIAKLLTPDLDESVPVTQSGVRVLTPAYASPEQLRGEPVTTASDVYGVGVVLYELLVGRRPFESRPESGPQPGDREPTRPSTAVTRAVIRKRADGTTESLEPDEIGRLRGTTPLRLRRRLRGDLDTILLRALHPEADRRYPSAEALAHDIERHLSGLPVTARRDSAIYRMGKFARRHAAAVAAAALVVVLGIVYAATITVQSRRIAAERDKAHEVTAFLESLFDAADPFSGTDERIDTLRVRAFIERGRLRLQDELDGQPAVRAQMLGVLGNAYRRMGLYEDAEPLLAQALAIRQELYGREHVDLAASLFDLAEAQANMGDFEAAERMHREALDMRRYVLGGRHPDVASSLRSLAWVVKEQGRPDEAVRHLQDALSIARPNPQDLAATLSLLGGTLTDMGRYDEAEPFLRESVDLRRQIYRREHPSVAVGLNNLAMLLRDAGRADEAEAALREALAINRATLGEAHPHVADNLNLLGSVLRQKGDIEAAEEVLREAVALSRAIYGDDHPTVSIKLDTYASLLRDKGDLDGAERSQREAIAIARAAFGDEHFSVAVTTSKLAGILHEKGELQDAAELFDASLGRMRRLLGDDHIYTATTATAYAAALQDLGRFDEAEILLLESYQNLRSTQGETGRYTQQTLRRLVSLYEAWQKPENAAGYRPLIAEASG